MFKFEVSLSSLLLIIVIVKNSSLSVVILQVVEQLKNVLSSFLYVYLTYF